MSYHEYFESKVNEQLMRASIQRKRGCRKLYRKSEWEQFRLPQGVPEMKDSGSFLQLRKYFHQNQIRSIEAYEGNREKQLSEMKEGYKALDRILATYQGKLILAGGCFTEQWTCKDLDFYFINCSEEEMEKIFCRCVTIVEEEQHQEIFVEIKEDVNNISFLGLDPVERDGPSKIKKGTYQFIKKNYCSMADVLLGFDMYGAMIAYDGQEIWATDIGAWAYVNSCNVVDISWISPYFGLRFEKYCNHKNFRMIFPGIKSIPNLQPYVLPNTKYSPGLIASSCRNLALAHDPLMKNGAHRFCFVLYFPANGKVLSKRAQVTPLNDMREYPKSNECLKPSQFYAYPDSHKMYLASPQVDTLLMLAHRFDKNSFLGWLPRDVFMLILLGIPFLD